MPRRAAGLEALTAAHMQPANGKPIDERTNARRQVERRTKAPTGDRTHIRGEGGKKKSWTELDLSEGGGGQTADARKGNRKRCQITNYN
jgi:hypothetical protein